MDCKTVYSIQTIKVRYSQKKSIQGLNQRRQSRSMDMMFIMSTELLVARDNVLGEDASIKVYKCTTH